jgi:DNA-binding protein
MDTKVLRHLSVALLPFGSYAMPASSYSTSPRSYLAATEQRPYANYLTGSAQHLPRTPLATNAEVGPELIKAQSVRELVIIDAAVPDKQVFYRGIKPGVEIIELDANQSGLAQLKQVLSAYQNLQALHIVSHADDGVLQLGNGKVDATALKQEMDTFAALKSALAEGADVLLYGCDLAKGEAGEELLALIQQETQLDVAASVNKTGAATLAGDWELELQLGQIDSELPFLAKSLQDFSAVLAPTNYTRDDFCTGSGNVNYSGNLYCRAASFTSDDGKLIVSSSQPYVLATAPNDAVKPPIISPSSEYGSYSGFMDFTADGTLLEAFVLEGITNFASNYPCASASLIGTPLAGGPNITQSIAWSTSESTFTPGVLAGVALTKLRLSVSGCTENGQGDIFSVIKIKNLAISEASSNTTPSFNDGATTTLTVLEDSAATSINSLLDVSDVDASQTLTWTVTSAPAKGSLAGFPATASSGSATVMPTGLTYTPTANASGADTFTVQVSDGTATDSIVVNTTITDINDAPTLTATGSTPTYTENASAVDLFSSVSVSAVESSQNISQLVLTVSNLADGASELLRVDGTDVTLTNTTSGTSSGGNSVGYSVAVAGSTATVTLTGNWTSAATQTLVDSLSYRNTSENPTEGANRVVTLTSIRDNGGTSNDGVDTTALSVAATVTVTAVNDAPSTPTDTNGTTNTVVENAANGTTVGLTASSTDPDGSVSYSLTDNAGGRFAIDSGTGVVTVLDGSLLDYETATSHNITVQATDGSLFSDQTFSIAVTDVDDTGPVVTNVSSTKGNGSYKAGEVISIQVTFDEAVTVSGGTPGLVLETGSTDQTASYSSGSPGTTLNFSYTVQAGDSSADLDYFSTAALVANGATLRDALNNDATLTLPTPGAAGSLGANKALVIDTEAPNAPSTPDLAEGSDSGSSSTDNITNNTTPTLTGTAEAGSTVTLYAGITPLGSATATGGDWSITAGPALSEGSYTLTAIAVDAAGNESAVSSGLSVTIDTTAPTVTSSVPDGAALTNAASLTYTVSFNDTVYGLATGDFTLTATDTASGSVSAVSAASGNSVDVTVSGITGTGTLRLDTNASGIADLAGNQAAAFTGGGTHIVDRDAPTISSVSFDPASDPVTAGNQTAVSFTLAGAETGTTAEYSITSSSGGTPVTASGIAIISAGQTISGVGVSGLNDGTLTLSLTLTDAAGNVSTPAVTDTVTKDANVPAVTTVAVADGAYKAGDTINFTVTLDDSVTVSGNHSTLGVNVGGADTTAAFASATGNTITYSYIVSASENTDSSGISILANSIELNGDTIRDSGNNNATLTFSAVNNPDAQIDTTDPVATVVTDPAEAVFVNAADYEIKGTHSEIGVTVNLYVDDNNDGAADDSANDIGHAIVDADGNWSIPNVTLTADTEHNYVVIAEDAAGNISVAVDVPTITEDSIAPVAAAITDPVIAVSVNTATQLIEGTHAEDGVTVELFADSDNDGVADNSTVLASADVASGVWSLPTVALTANTANNFVVIAKDKAGNVSAAVDVATITQDSLAPVVTVTALTTADTTPALTGTVDDATASLSLTVAGQTLAPTNNGNGSWTLADNQLTALTNGVYDVQVTATDEQGNIGTDASSNELTIDLLAPAGYSASIVQERINATNQAAMSFVFAGAEVGSSYNYSVSDGTNSVTGSGTVSSATQQVAGINVTALAEGTLQLSVTLTDTLGNVGAAATDTVLKRYNSEPVNPGNSTASVEEDTTLRITLAVQDPENDTLTYELVNQPAHGTAVVQGSQLIYTPELNYNGTDSISYIASDSEFSTQAANIAITVTAVNDNPLAEDDSYSLQRVESNQYQLAVLANDSDVDGDTLTIDGASTSVGTVVFNAQGLTLTTPDLYVGPVSLRYTLTDGNGGRDTADVNLIIEGGAAANLPVITVPADIEVNATALFTRVPLGTATAVDRNGRRLRVSLINGSLFFAPGEHIVYWQATDADGNTATKAQRVRVNPLVSLSKDQLVIEGNEVEFQVILNGPAPVYPVSVPYTVSGSAGANDHTLVSGVAEISSGLSTTIRFSVLEDALADSPEDIIITLDSSVNRGSKRSSRIVVSEANVAPVVSLTVQQNGENRLTISESGGVVTVTATVTDANPQDQITGVWDFGRLTNVTSDQTQFSFDPTEQGPGLYLVSYTATDNGTPNLSATSRVFIVLRPNLPTLGSDDTDGDLVPDDQEGFADSDGDGIPDYQDAINECNVMPTELLGQTQFVAEGEPGVCLRLGTVAAETDAGGLQIAKDAVVTDNVAVNIGGIFDFIAYGLPEQGKSYSLVIPQRLPVPANAVYRKFSDVTGWVDFVSNERNSVSSTAGERGFCPPPGDAAWTEGLTEGHWCVQVTVEDGGPNDADGIANSAIVDPGGVAVVLNGNNLPVAAADEASVLVDTSIDVNVLANDTDVDGDTLTVNQAISSFGTVTILADQQLSYTPNPDFVGTDTVIYSITDGKGGTASSELVVNVFSNTAPVAVNDSASTDDRTAILIAVLTNDTDAEGDVLTVTAASAEEGTVSIEADQRLRYTPKAGFNGVDTISYTVTDSSGDSATGSVSVTVRAYQDVVVDNKSSGGSMTWWMGMVLAGAVMLRRRSVMGVAAVALLAFSPWSQGQDWYLQGSVGHSTADQKQNRLVEELPSGTITAFDDSDSLYGITLGYQLHPYFAVEMGYQDLGEASAQLSGDSLTPEQYHELVKAVSPVLVDGWTAAARFTLWQSDVWNVEVPLGLFRWDSEIESSRGNSTLYSKTNGTDWFLGVQLNYSLSDNLKFGLGYQQLELDANDVSSWLLSVRYEF